MVGWYSGMGEVDAPEDNVDEPIPQRPEESTTHEHPEGQRRKWSGWRARLTGSAVLRTGEIYLANGEFVVFPHCCSE